MAVKVQFEIGHISKLRVKKTPNGFTHDWELYVKGVNGSDISHYVDKVVFHLHDSFPKPKRVIKEPPYMIHESGYAGFVLPIDIHFRNRDEPKFVQFSYDLDLQNAGPPQHRFDIQTYIFENPSEEFRQRLMKGGGVPVAGVISCGAPTKLPPSIHQEQRKTQLQTQQFNNNSGSGGQMTNSANTIIQNNTQQQTSSYNTTSINYNRNNNNGVSGSNNTNINNSGSNFKGVGGSVSSGGKNVASTHGNSGTTGGVTSSSLFKESGSSSVRSSNGGSNREKDKNKTSSDKHSNISSKDKDSNSNSDQRKDKNHKQSSNRVASGDNNHASVKKTSDKHDKARNDKIDDRQHKKESGNGGKREKEQSRYKEKSATLLSSSATGAGISSVGNSSDKKLNSNLSGKPSSSSPAVNEGKPLSSSNNQRVNTPISGSTATTGNSRSSSSNSGRLELTSNTGGASAEHAKSVLLSSKSLKESSSSNEKPNNSKANVSHSSSSTKKYKKERREKNKDKEKEREREKEKDHKKHDTTDYNKTSSTAVSASTSNSNTHVEDLNNKAVINSNNNETTSTSSTTKIRSEKSPKPSVDSTKTSKDEDKSVNSATCRESFDKSKVRSNDSTSVSGFSNSDKRSHRHKRKDRSVESKLEKEKSESQTMDNKNSLSSNRDKDNSSRNGSEKEITKKDGKDKDKDKSDRTNKVSNISTSSIKDTKRSRSRSPKNNELRKTSESQKTHEPQNTSTIVAKKPQNKDRKMDKSVKESYVRNGKKSKDENSTGSTKPKQNKGDHPNISTNAAETQNIALSEDSTSLPTSEKNPNALSTKHKKVRKSIKKNVIGVSSDSSNGSSVDLSISSNKQISTGNTTNNILNNTNHPTTSTTAADQQNTTNAPNKRKTSPSAKSNNHGDFSTNQYKYNNNKSTASSVNSNNGSSSTKLEKPERKRRRKSSPSITNNNDNNSKVFVEPTIKKSRKDQSKPARDKVQSSSNRSTDKNGKTNSTTTQNTADVKSIELLSSPSIPFSQSETASCNLSSTVAPLMMPNASGQNNIFSQQNQLTVTNNATQTSAMNTFTNASANTLQQPAGIITPCYNTAINPQLPSHNLQQQQQQQQNEGGMLTPPLEYMHELQDLHDKIMNIQNNIELQQVVELIAKTGLYEVTSQTFDFDLCRLDRNTVQQLQEFLS